jgi:hypothetical protein
MSQPATSPYSDPGRMDRCASTLPRTGLTCVGAHRTMESISRRALTNKIRSCGCPRRASFDDPDLISHAGLVPLSALAQRAGLHGLTASHVRPARDAGLKVACTSADMAADTASMDDVDLLHHRAIGGWVECWSRSYWGPGVLPTPQEGVGCDVDAGQQVAGEPQSQFMISRRCAGG